MTRSTELRCAAAAVLVLAACGRGPVAVEAPMVAADASAPVTIASANAVRARPRDPNLPFERGDRLRGFYFCAQGRTDLTLVVEDIVEDEIAVVFEFNFPGSNTFDPAVGSYRMRGTFDARDRTLRLKADRWIDQPQGYQMVDLVGSVNRSGAITGSITGTPSCSTFNVSPDRSRDGPGSP